MTEYDRARQVIMSAPDPPMVVSLGAYRGEDDTAFRSCGRYFQHVMVEPDPENCHAIRNLVGLDKGRSIIQAAVAESSGTRTFWRSHDSRDDATGSGSLLRPTGHLEHFPTITFSTTAIAVPAFSLDDIAKIAGIDRIDLLWVDIQGAEAEMIRGGQDALAHTRYMMIEAEKFEFYEGQTLKPDLLAMLPGWQVIEDFGFNVFLFNKGA